MAKLTHEEFKKYTSALQDAFRTIKDLGNLYRVVFNKELSIEYSGNSLGEAVDVILRECGSHNKFPELIRTALDIIPTNEELKSLLDDINQGNSLEEHGEKQTNDLEQVIGFVNRTKELEIFLASPSQPSRYWVIDAPAGYGKSQLLAEVEKRLPDDWLIVRVAFPRHPSKPPKNLPYPSIIDLVAMPIVAELHEQSDIADKTQTLEDVGMEISTSILMATRKQIKDKLVNGIVITIDNFENCPDDEVQGFVQLMSGIFNGLYNTNVFFKSKHLRVFIAGRYARNKIKNAREHFMMADIALAPFTFEVITETIQEFAISKGFSDGPRRAEDIAAHLMHITGGHPGFTAEILNLLAKDGFTKGTKPLIRNSRQYQEKFTEKFHSQLIEEAPMLHEHQLIDILVKLSPFRKYDRWFFLKELKDRKMLPDDLDEEAIEKGLLSTYLVDREGGFLHDGIYRYLLEIWLRLKQPTLYAKLCNVGIEIYKKQLDSGDHIKRIEKWAIEFIYLNIVQNYYVKHIKGDDLVQQTKNDMLWVIGMLAHMKQNFSASDIDGVREDFIKDLERDAELRFLFNFCTAKNEHFEIMPFENLLLYAYQEFDKLL